MGSAAVDEIVAVAAETPRRMDVLEPALITESAGGMSAPFARRLIRLGDVSPIRSLPVIPSESDPVEDGFHPCCPPAKMHTSSRISCKRLIAQGDEDDLGVAEPHAHGPEMFVISEWPWIELLV